MFKRTESNGTVLTSAVILPFSQAFLKLERSCASKYLWQRSKSSREYIFWLLSTDRKFRRTILSASSGRRELGLVGDIRYTEPNLRSVLEPCTHRIKVARAPLCDVHCDSWERYASQFWKFCSTKLLSRSDFFLRLVPQRNDVEGKCLYGMSQVSFWKRHAGF